MSDCEIPNCRAMALGLTPALKAARTAFSLPVVNKPVPSLAIASARGRGFASGVGFSFAGLDGSRPRRPASAVTAASNASISVSSNHFWTKAAPTHSQRAGTGRASSAGGRCDEALKGWPCGRGQKRHSYPHRRWAMRSSKDLGCSTAAEAHALLERRGATSEILLA